MPLWQLSRALWQLSRAHLHLIKRLTIIHYAFLIIQFVSKDMPHADASLIPSRYVVIFDHRILSHHQDEALKVNQNSGHMSIHSWRILSGKSETGWLFLHSNTILLTHGWYEVTNCANASSLIYNSLLAFPAYFGTASDKAVNWCGMLLRSTPQPGILIAVHPKRKH